MPLPRVNVKEELCMEVLPLHFNGLRSLMYSDFKLINRIFKKYLYSKKVIVIVQKNLADDESRWRSFIITGHSNGD